jgi:hypothetical protein
MSFQHMHTHTHTHRRFTHKLKINSTIDEKHHPKLLIAPLPPRSHVSLWIPLVWWLLHMGLNRLFQQRVSIWFSMHQNNSI